MHAKSSKTRIKNGFELICMIHEREQSLEHEYAIFSFKLNPVRLFAPHFLGSLSH